MEKLRRLGLAWICLMGLLGLTVLTSLFDWGATNALVNMGIAVAKAAIIAIVFMQLGARDRLSALTAGVVIVWLGILFLFPLIDYATR